MTYKKYFLIFMFFVFLQLANSQKKDSSEFSYHYSLKELSELTITTGSIKEEKRKAAPSNITIITNQMIEERGYKTLVDICQDIPGFDFMMYNDGGGEYSTFSMNRGIGDVGNPEILIMVDGIVQNSISFNWSLLWTYENILIDVERIEIIQGPGSVMYGAQAFSGIIHLVTKKNFEGIHVNTWYGSHSTRATEIFAGTKLGDNTKFSIAYHNYYSTGDSGEDRYDPGNYFTNIKRPSLLIKDYNNEGNYVTNTANPRGGTLLNNGFNTQNNNYAIRSKLTHKNYELGFFISEFTRAYGSAIVAYEYDLTDKENTIHYQNYHIYASNTTAINSKLSLKSDAVYRATNIIPDGGFKYLYQFPDLRKSYAAYSYQLYTEEKLLYNLNAKNDLSFGIKACLSNENNRIVSLGSYPDTKYVTNTSWDIASAGDGLNQTKKYPYYWVKEIAFFALWDHQFNKKFSSSAGIRYDYNSEYGGILNPRFAIDYNPSSLFGAKFIYGRAFRQPSIFELHDEFRGNPNLTPQNIHTSEIELSSLMLNDQVSLKFNIYYSFINDLIGKVEDSTMPAGERYENIGKKKIGGFSFNAHYQLNQKTRVYSNYNFLTGFSSNSDNFYDIDRTAKNKINAGINVTFLNNSLVTDFRLNYVGVRKAPITNTWLQTYKNGYAPSYTKANMVISYKFASHFMLQLIVNNVFNTKYYGVGRESGSGFIDDYDYIENVNPEGVIPSYHPQPMRTAFIHLTYKLNK